MTLLQRVLVGGTASGKKAVAAELFARHGLPLLSMDSMKVYRGMDVGTDKPDAALRGRAPFALLDLVGHDESFSLGRWAAAAAAETARAPAGVLFAGGTPLYLRALLLGLCPTPPADPLLREELSARWDRDGEAAVRAELAALDGESAARLFPGDRKRLLRALEVAHLTGRPLSEWQRERTAPVVPGRIVVAALARTAEDALARQSARASAMLRRGLVEEVDALAARAPFATEPGRAIGYAEVLAWRAGRLREEQVLPNVITRTRQLQRKQRMFLAALPGIRWVPVASGASLAEVVADVERALEL
ncbi:MAG TPA: tRNA (adenosine(37)-N6)-dimethylallyltransferase MiaA [Planctomycetota bacterium]|nr:tRNA (adenosine(37)-N6)-dimethylallyltransferase MiaA [Planctomycetota bacterium]